MFYWVQMFSLTCFFMVGGLDLRAHPQLSRLYLDGCLVERLQRCMLWLSLGMTFFISFGNLKKSKVEPPYVSGGT